jgi:glyoxylase-like metal-dependent hydrolase (beta-lactamase superfamily II)
MRISKNVEMLELNTVLANGPGVINPVIIWDEKDVILFDAGLPDMWVLFQEAAVNSGIPIERLNKILITHSDMDHIGSLSQIIHEIKGEITVFAHKEEKPYIECDLLPVRVKQMEDRIALTTGVMQEQLISMTENLKKSYQIFKVEVNKTIEDDEVLPFYDGIKCIYTPGHTPGHMCYYLEKLKLLIAGDILQVEDGELIKCPDFTVLDKDKVIASLNKLRQYKIETVVCYHGGLFHGNVTNRILEILSELQN